MRGCVFPRLMCTSFMIGCIMLFTWIDGAMAEEKIILYHAGSLSVPLEKMEGIFESAHPGTDIIGKAGGSTRMARLIAERNERADIMASADFTVIDELLIPDKATWNIRFASNQLVLCYTGKSRYASEVRADNWYDILTRKGVPWGHSDPDLDPCGYRSLMVLQLAEVYYNKPGLYDRLITGLPPENVRPKARELVELLKSGQMDYAWEYLSVAVQHGLKYVVLDDHINLGNYRYDDFYKQAEVKVTGNKPGTWITHRGRSCTYGLTLIHDAPNPGGAVRFLQYMLAPEGGLHILKEMGQPPIIPCRVESEAMKRSLPGALADLVEVSE